LGISFALVEEMTGAASLWMDSIMTGEAAASSGSVKPRNDFMTAKWMIKVRRMEDEV
jgi:hypothetical protein